MGIERPGNFDTREFVAARQAFEWLTLVLVTFALINPVQAADSDWEPQLTVAGVRVEALPTTSGFHAHRGQVLVCSDFDTVTRFVADISQFHEWVAYTREARVLETAENRIVYYLKNDAPWPFSERDMIYELVTHSADDRDIHVGMTGLPNYLPRVEGVVRLDSVAGDWHFTAVDGGVRVMLELFVNPGSVPKFLANRRFANTVGQTLANLSGQFPCDEKPAVPNRIQ